MPGRVQKPFICQWRPRNRAMAGHTWCKPATTTSLLSLHTGVLPADISLMPLPLVNMFYIKMVQESYLLHLTLYSVVFLTLLPLEATIKTEIKNLGNNPVIGKDDPILIFYMQSMEPRLMHHPDCSALAEKIQILLPHDFVFGGWSNSWEGQGILHITLSSLLRDLAEK
ncbi:hypothetical protein IW262DRAFT_1300652 [Armillaria fumosa]|nr:hypothetical protein IW262DRAFT_1300652 [Armillaria fumosa]